MEKEVLICSDSIQNLRIEDHKARTISNFNALFDLDLASYQAILVIQRSYVQLEDLLRFARSIDNIIVERIILICEPMSFLNMRALIEVGIKRIYISNFRDEHINELVKALISEGSKVEAPIRIDPNGDLVIRDSKIPLSQQEAEILRLLLNRRFPVHISEIIKTLDEGHRDRTVGSIRVTITRLKKKIYECSGYRPIANKYGKGYFVKYTIPS